MRDPNWLREPGPSGEPIIYISIPEGAKLTPQIAEALTHLSGALHDLGKEAPAKKSPCQPLKTCNLDSCLPMTTSNCFRYETCRVQV
jgi:hypothetical protein